MKNICSLSKIVSFCFIFIFIIGCTTPPPPVCMPSCTCPPDSHQCGLERCDCPVTPPPPDPEPFLPNDSLTINTLNRMRQTSGFNISNYQFWLSDGFVLEEVDIITFVDANNETVDVINNMDRNKITFNPLTGGKAFSITGNSISVGFEAIEGLSFLFAPIGNDRQFYLQFDPSNDPDDPRETITYGGVQYFVTLSGGRPYLRMHVSRENETLTEPQTIRGRSSSAAGRAPLVAFTIRLMDLLWSVDEIDINHYQLYLSDGITLERYYEDRDQSVTNDGRAVFRDNRKTIRITIGNQTAGQVMQTSGSDLLVSFDSANDYHQLRFSATGGENSPYELQFNPANQRSMARGNVNYGSLDHDVFFTGGRPVLMIRLSERDIERLSERTASGLMIGD